MKVSRFTVNSFCENTYILWDEKSSEAIIVDPGMSTDKEREKVDNFIAEHNLTLRHLLLTHMHLDHAIGANYIAEKYKLPICCAAEEQVFGERQQVQAKMFGLQGIYSPVRIDVKLVDGDIITLGEEEIRVIQVAGHSPGGLTFYCMSSSVLFPGDVLFEGSIGRTDLAGGDYDKLITGIKEKLFILPDDTLVCPGHGNTTTIGDEKLTNPYVR